MQELDPKFSFGHVLSGCPVVKSAMNASIAWSIVTVTIHTSVYVCSNWQRVSESSNWKSRTFQWKVFCSSVTSVWSVLNA